MYRVNRGDCRDYLPRLKDDSVDLVVIDPPYGIDQLNQEWDDEKIRKSIDASERSVVKNIPVGMKFDPRDARKLGEFLYGIFVELKRALKPGGFCIVFSQARSCHHVGVSLENAGFELREQMIWDYGAGQGKAQGMQNFIRKNKNLSEEQKAMYIKEMQGFKTPQLTPTFETMWLAQKPREGKFWENFMKYGVGLVDFREGNRKVKFSFSKPNKVERRSAGNHPTLKPVDLMVELISVFSLENSTVLDCFAGSGTVGVACQKTNRSFVGIEKSEEWFAVMQERLKLHEGEINKEVI